MKNSWNNSVNASENLTLVRDTFLVTFGNGSETNRSGINSSLSEFDGVVQISAPANEFIFDRTDVRIVMFTLYLMVFCCCFCGNLLVILVVTMSRRLRSITNFFLANLAVADFCVGVFCVMQNLSIYLIPSWVFGDFLCKMYQFTHSLSYTASIFILVVICMERYFAIIHPITCKQILTSTRLRLVIGGVWITSAVYSIPKFIFVRTITNNLGDGTTETICIMYRKRYDSKLFDLINFGLLYVIPLLVMTILYSRIAITLWKSSQGLERNIAMKNTPQYNSESTHGPMGYDSPQNSHHLSTMNASSRRSKNNRRHFDIVESQTKVSMSSEKGSTWRTQSFRNPRHQHMHHIGTQLTQVSHSSSNVLRARRGVIRMLMVVVLTFALCNLPFHARKMWQYWSNDYKGASNFNALFTPLTFLVTYFNSGVNPILYAFLSRNFRKGMRELLMCSFKKNQRPSIRQRLPLQTHSLPTDSTHVGNNPT
ncbi:trissin receptor isoform X3 [Phlebotomus papatasi]|uniref:trissin receptor isoform X3 n=1 Tax=Phlebotomus papatasi TaxID=29031 RepID=UPI0024841593|nr:trissin receptor isoform X3 [Phlebotomus papatasi]